MFTVHQTLMLLAIIQPVQDGPTPLAYRMQTGAIHHYRGNWAARIDGYPVGAPIHLTVERRPAGLTEVEFAIRRIMERDEESENPLFKGKPIELIRAINLDDGTLKTQTGWRQRDVDLLMLSNPLSMIIPCIPVRGKKNLTTRQICSYNIIRYTEMKIISPFGGSKGDKIATLTPQAGIETYRYKVTSNNSQIARVDFTYSAETHPDYKKTSTLQGSGKGYFLFDVQGGFPLHIELEGESSIKGGEKNSSQSVAFKLDFDPIPTAAKNISRLDFSAEPPLPALSDTACEHAIKMLESTQPKMRRNAVLAFYRHRANPKSKSTVVQALQKTLDKLDDSEKYWCASAIGAWGEEDSANFLRGLLTTGDHATKLGAIEGLSYAPSKQSAEAVAKLVREDKLVAQIARSLKKMKQNGVKQMQAYINPEKPSVCCNACKVLAVIGTSECLEDLEMLAGHEDADIARSAREAMLQIRQRK